MASITKDKTSKGQARYRVRVVVGYKPDGSPIQKMRTFDSMKEATAAGKAAETDRARGVTTPSGKLRLDVFLAQWWERATKRVRPSTQHHYRYVLDTHILPGIGSVRLVELSRASIQAWIDTLPTPSTAKQSARLLHAALAEAVDLELLAANPADRVKLPRQLPSPAQSWSREEARAFLAVAANQLYQPYWTLAIRLGLRPSELLALRWSAVDVEVGTLSVREAAPIVGVSRFHGAPKSASGARTLDLPGDIVGLLRCHKTRQYAPRLALGPAWPDLVCTSRLGLAIDYRSLYFAFKRLCTVAGVPAIRLYDLRHTAISLMAEAGADFKAVSEIAGHSDMRLTRQVYQHVNRGQRRAALAALGEALAEPDADLRQVR